MRTLKFQTGQLVEVLSAFFFLPIKLSNRCLWLISTGPKKNISPINRAFLEASKILKRMFIQSLSIRIHTFAFKVGHYLQSIPVDWAHGETSDLCVKWWYLTSWRKSANTGGESCARVEVWRLAHGTLGCVPSVVFPSKLTLKSRDWRGARQQLLSCSAGRRTLIECLPERGKAWEPVSHSVLAQSPQGSWGKQADFVEKKPSCVWMAPSQVFRGGL